MAQGMLGITPMLEAQGRGGDTEVGMISTGSVVIPVVIMETPEGKKLSRYLRPVYEQNQLNVKQFTVTAPNETYADSTEAVQAHLTVGEFVIPPSVLNTVPNLTEKLATLFEAIDTSIDVYTVGNEANNINPQTGLPEFWGWNPFKAAKKLVSNVTKAVTKTVSNVGNAIGDVVEGIGNAVQDVVFDPVNDFLANVDDALHDVVDVVDEAIQNPYVRAVVSVVYPPAAPYLNAYAKLDSGESLNAADIASLAISSTSDLGGIEIDPNIAKAVETGAKIADGEDPVSTLVSTYGADFAKELKLDTAVKDTFSNTFDIDTSNWLTDRMDMNQLAADFVAGTDTNRMIANQFGDDIAGYIGSGDPNLTALGYAGIESAIALDNSEDPADALMAGAKEYYDRGGQLPDVAALGELTGIDASNFDWNTYLPKIDIPAVDLLGQGYDWLASRNIDFGNMDLSGLKALDLGIDFKGLQDLNVNLGDLNWKDFNIADTGMSVSELKGLDVNLPDMNFNGIPFPDLMLGLTAAAIGETPEQTYIDPFADTTVEEDTTANPLAISQALLKSTPIV